MPAQQPWPATDETRYWIFTPPEGGTWGMSFASFAQALRAREPEAFLGMEPAEQLDVPGASAPLRLSASLDFGITLDGSIVEGVAKERAEGVAIDDATAGQAAEFTEWLRAAIVPRGASVTCNTRHGIESDLPDLLVDGLDRDALVRALLEHLGHDG